MAIAPPFLPILGRNYLMKHSVGDMFSTADLLRKAEDAPTVPGAYVLLIGLAAPVEVALSGKPKATLCAGHYLYCGSAKGSGGIRSRLARHMRAEKLVRWHVDRLTKAGAAIGAWTFPGGNECDLVRTLSHLSFPIRGFGSTDCRMCQGHLLRWQAYQFLENCSRNCP
jgi:Uri superfamily endonuclease